jgi:hypothetical protein
VSVIGKAAMGLAVLAITGGAGLIATLPAGAATPACGAGCITVFNQDFGNGYVAAVAGGPTRIGQLVKLSPAADTSTEDWQLIVEGGVADLYTEGLVTEEVATLFGEDVGYEIEYTPDGVASGLCLGLRVVAHEGEKARLEICGVNSRTIWVGDAADQSGRFEPLVPGSDTTSTSGLVLTGSATDKALTVTQVSVTSGTIAPDQMWQSLYGPLS